MNYHETTLPRRVRRQQLPHLHPGGDCGACVLGGLVDLDVPQVYKLLKKDPVTSGFGHTEMLDSLYILESINLLDRHVVDLPIWQSGQFKQFQWYGLPGWQMFDCWFRYVRMAIDAGYYGICCVVHAKNGPLADPDHWVMICGTRERVVPHATVPEAGVISSEILISNSSLTPPAMDQEWVDAREFLMKWGGYNVALARPTRAPVATVTLAS